MDQIIVDNENTINKNNIKMQSSKASTGQRSKNRIQQTNSFTDSDQFQKDLPPSDTNEKELNVEKNVIDSDVKITPIKFIDNISTYQPPIQYNHFYSGKQRFLIKSVPIKPLEQTSFSRVNSQLLLDPLINTPSPIQSSPASQLPPLIETPKLSQNLQDQDLLIRSQIPSGNLF